MDRLTTFERNCTRCPRLAENLAALRRTYPDYYNAPVPAFGDPEARLLIVGLAPGLHGANASGRPFTGDFAGILLYRTLYECGFATAPESRASDDGLRLIGCRISNAVKCVPPQNKPTTSEADTCNAYLRAELDNLVPGSIILALGAIAHRAVLKAFGQPLSAHAFGHAAVHDLPREHTLIDSYHCSRYNTQTGRLTEAMFLDVMRHAGRLLEARR
jgi:uracil-DNA glycosylase family 4